MPTTAGEWEALYRESQNELFRYKTFTWLIYELHESCVTDQEYVESVARVVVGSREAFK